MNMGKVLALGNAEYNFELWMVIWEVMHRWRTRRSCLQSRTIPRGQQSGCLQWLYGNSSRERQPGTGGAKVGPYQTPQWQDCSVQSCCEATIPQLQTWLPKSRPLTCSPAHRTSLWDTSTHRCSSINHLECFTFFYLVSKWETEKLFGNKESIVWYQSLV